MNAKRFRGCPSRKGSIGLKFYDLLLEVLWCTTDTLDWAILCVAACKKISCAHNWNSRTIIDALTVDAVT